MERRWEIHDPVSHDLASHFPELHPVALQLLVNRGITDRKFIEQFLNPDYEADTHDPFLFRDMRKAVDRIFNAIERKEKIVVHGDYDADGVCASSVIITILKDLGADVGVYLPHREKEGYGVNTNTIEYLAKEGTNLIITVDCGTANVEPIELAQDYGIDVIITDHHHVPEVTPKAFALINPQDPNDTYPFGYLCGAAVAFKLAQALCISDQHQPASKLAEGYEKWLLDLVAIATIADMMPLTDENRVLVKYGLIVLQKTRRIGLKKLLESAGVWNYGQREVTPFDVGFVIGPRINAAGRMDHANAAYELLMAPDELETLPLVENIEINNRDRRAMTDKIVEEVLEQVEDSDEYLLFAYGTGWPIGLAGLAASKVLQITGKPAIVMTKLEDRIAGSGRSVAGFDMAAALEEMQDMFDTAGGHAAACGFSLKAETDPYEVMKVFKEKARAALEGKDLRPVIEIDMELAAADITWKLYDQVQRLAPFGKENEEPVFVTRDLVVEEVRAVGDDRHLKLRLQEPSLFKSFSAIAFGFGELAERITSQSKIDLVYTLDSNEWNGTKELQLKVKDIRLLDDDTIL